jgi:predicted nucleic acid-binding protein
MTKTIISDTSCLIILTNINEIDLLRRVYEQIVTTKEVAEEYGQMLPEWIEIKSSTDQFRQRILALQIDRGEASAIALAIETPHSVVIIDDYKARKVAERLGIEIIGTIGIIIKAKRQGIIESIKPFLKKIKQTDFRISEEIEKRALQESGE